MGLTDGPILNWRSTAPEDLAMEYIDNVRRKEAVRARCLGSPYDSTIKPIPLWACFRYLESIGQGNWDCNCSAKGTDGAAHVDLCSVTPEFAAVSKEFRQFLVDAGKGPMSIWQATSMLSMTMWFLDWDNWDDQKKAIKEMGW